MTLPDPIIITPSLISLSPEPQEELGGGNTEKLALAQNLSFRLLSWSEQITDNAMHNSKVLVAIGSDVSNTPL